MTCKNFPKERNPRNTQQRQELGWSCSTHPQSQETRSFSVFILHVQFSHLRHNLGESAIGDKNFVWEVKLMSDIIHVSKSCGRTEFLGETLCICPPLLLQPVPEFLLTDLQEHFHPCCLFIWKTVPKTVLQAVSRKTQQQVLSHVLVLPKWKHHPCRNSCPSCPGPAPCSEEL